MGFKGAPNFVKWPDPVDGMWKIGLLRWLGQVTGIKTLVETGTCEGVTPFNLKDDFDEIHTIELHDGLFAGAERWLAPYRHIRCYHGSSRTMLRELLASKAIPPGPAIFWLDAHSSGPHTANDGDPLSDELRAIVDLRPNALVVIDDMMGLDQFRGQVSSVDLSGWKVEYRTGEIVLHAHSDPERYSIPPFEP